MTEHKFKVGDWVRATASDEVVSIGDIGKVEENNSAVPFVDWIGKKRWAYLEGEMEPWTPRVGERVNVDWIGWDGEGIVKIVYDKNTYFVQMISGNSNGFSGAFGLGSLSPIIPPSTPPATPAASPVRTVTRKEIVTGVYGDVEVAATNEDGVSIWLLANSRYTSARLRTMIATLTEIADALDSNS